MAEIGVLELPDGLELGRGVHRGTPFPVPPGSGPAAAARVLSVRVGGRGRGRQAFGRAAERNASASPPTASCRDDRGTALLARASPSLTLQGRWFLPGRRDQHGERPADSLRREMEEESGLTVTVGPLLDVISDVRTAARRHELPHRAADLPGRRLGRGRCAPRPTGPPTPSTGSERRAAHLPLAHYVKRWCTTVCEREPRPPKHHVVIVGSRLRRPLRRQAR